MNIRKTIFEKLKAELLNELLPLGFAIQADKYSPEVFGSRYIRLQKGKQAIQLAWDGKEYWFILEACPNIDARPFPDWQKLAFQKFDPTIETNFDDNQFVVSIKTFSQKWI